MPRRKGRCAAHFLHTCSIRPPAPEPQGRERTRRTRLPPSRLFVYDGIYRLNEIAWVSPLRQVDGHRINEAYHGIWRGPGRNGREYTAYSRPSVLPRASFGNRITSRGE